jgi:hypothetical protein
MKLSSLLLAFSASGGAAAFLQPSNSPQLQQHLQHRENNVDVGFLTPTPSSSLHMVAIRGPFWHAFDRKVDSKVKTVSSEEFIVDRDFSVATTLMAVGIWLTCFGPSK